MARVCQEARRRAAFIVGEYDADGEPQLPAMCPLSAGGACRLVVHHYRERKTGPSHALAVVYCHTHGCYVTAYPAGFVPYARQPIAPPPEVALEEARGGESLIGTVTSSASTEKDVVASRPPRRTAARQLQRIARMLGLHPDQDQRQRPRWVRLLSADALLLRAQAAAWAAARTLGERADALLTVLRAIYATGPPIAERLAGGATMAGLVGRAYRCDHPGGGLRRLFC